MILNMEKQKIKKKHSVDELKMLKCLPLDVKIQKTRIRIEEWVEYFGEDSVYVSFSGGKDSTVLLDIVRKDYPGIEAVFVNTGLEYPSISQFALSKQNVIEIRPEVTFRDVIINYGYPMIGKRQSRFIHDLQTSGEHNKNTVNLRLTGFNRNGIYCPSMRLSKKWLFMKDAPFFVSERCCDEMKKKPLKSIQNTRRNPIIGMLAEESKFREEEWKQNGCNAFDSKHPKSNPMSFWTNQDILTYIHTYNIDISEAYGQIVRSDPHVSIYEYAGDYSKCKYKTTGCKRTGCIFCGFGITQDKQRFVRLSEQEPKLCDYVMRGGEFNTNGMFQPSKEGLGYWFVLEWLNVFGNLNIGIPNRDKYMYEYATQKHINLLKKGKT